MHKILLILVCLLALTGCQTVGINTQASNAEWLVLKPGKPAQIMQNINVPCRLLNGGTVKDQDIGYWIAMPPEHWQSLQQEISRLRKQVE